MGQVSAGGGRGRGGVPAMPAGRMCSACVAHVSMLRVGGRPSGASAVRTVLRALPACYCSKHPIHSAAAQRILLAHPSPPTGPPSAWTAAVLDYLFFAPTPQPRNLPISPTLPLSFGCSCRLEAICLDLWGHMQEQLPAPTPQPRNIPLSSTLPSPTGPLCRLEAICLDRWGRMQEQLRLCYPGITLQPQLPELQRIFRAAKASG